MTLDGAKSLPYMQVKPSEIRDLRLRGSTVTFLMGIGQLGWFLVAWGRTL